MQCCAKVEKTRLEKVRYLIHDIPIYAFPSCGSNKIKYTFFQSVGVLMLIEEISDRNIRLDE
jgi:hypothetical protein